MSHYKSTSLENGFAVLTDRLSAVCAATPNTIGKFVMGDHPTRWHRTVTPASQVNWLHVDGVKSSGLRPATYTHAVVLETEVALLGTYAQEDSPVRFAGAYAIGSNVLAADIDLDPKDKNAASDLLGEGTVQVALRVGKNAVDVSLGGRRPEENAFADIGEPFMNIALPPTPIEQVAEQYPGAYWL